jgi:hypothetical protein
VLAGARSTPRSPRPTTSPTEAVALPLAELLARAVARRGAVLAARAALDAAREGAAAAHAEATRPEFMVGLSAWIDPDHHNGYGATAGMTLPWLWGPGRARERAAAARVRAEEGAVRESEDAVRAEVVEAHARMEGALRELAVMQGDATRAADRAVESAQAGYVTGAVTLLAWLDAARMRLDLSMEVDRPPARARPRRRRARRGRRRGAPPRPRGRRRAVSDGTSPRAERVMALVRWALLVAVTALASVALYRAWGPLPDRAGPSAARARYYCPMHPQITADAPGECPICHMALERVDDRARRPRPRPERARRPTRRRWSP